MTDDTPKIKRTLATDKAEEIVRDYAQRGAKRPGKKELQRIYGISHMAFEKAIDRIDKESTAAHEPIVDPESLGKTNQQRLAMALRQQSKALELDFERKVQAEANRRLASALALFNEKEELYNSVINAANGVMSADDYTAVLKALHPDRRGHVEETELRAAFQVFQPLKGKLVKPETQRRELPGSVTDLDKWRRKRG